MSTPEMSAVHLPDFNSTLGAIFVGAIISTLLYGIATLQTWIYFNTFPLDKIVYKFFVGGLWIVDTFHSICIVHAVYYYLVTNFTNPSVLESGEWSIDLSTVISAIVACSCQAFFTVRVWTLGRNWVITGLCAVLCLARFAFSVITTWASFNVVPYARYEADYTWSIRAGLAVATASDIVIAAAMVFYLRNARGVHHRTNKVISRLLTFTVETCLLTSIVTTVDVICFSTMPDNFVFLGIYFLVSKLYTNALLTSLNVRTSLRGQLEGGITTFSAAAGAVGGSNLSGSTLQGLRSQRNRPPAHTDPEAAVMITMETFETTETSGVNHKSQEGKQSWMPQ